ncbi:hypothetical protein BO85DRAFT_511370 [Aspergillus piperis CBS 112811]|uniref:Uncharacterized protein n=1 Tax=Aspergillus piperis CBS 112811 TaxID=1448313 RepID=A0A8G1R2P6_9EURO|nr:hypothetical protein BO85DRAFT_511370 [Aspergillus piperis CBS 112811]RAH58931.1 hypothetical protein BO85DRAFT_511370 [Aspergillus piperis CBS 112811]
MAMADARYGDIDSIFDSRDGGIWSRVRCSGSAWAVPGNGHHFRLRFSLCRLERGRRELPKVGKSRSSERWGFRVRRGQNRVWLETAGPHWMGYS